MIVKKKIMCLTTKIKYPRISFWDIKVKKVILIEEGIDNCKSLYKDFKLEKDREYYGLKNGQQYFKHSLENIENLYIFKEMGIRNYGNTHMEGVHSLLPQR